MTAWKTPTAKTFLRSPSSDGAIRMGQGNQEIKRNKKKNFFSMPRVKTKTRTRNINNGIKLKASSAGKFSGDGLFVIFSELSVRNSMAVLLQSQSLSQWLKCHFAWWRRKWMKLSCQYHITFLLQLSIFKSRKQIWWQKIAPFNSELEAHLHINVTTIRNSLDVRGTTKDKSELSFHITRTQRLNLAEYDSC